MSLQLKKKKKGDGLTIKLKGKWEKRNNVLQQKKKKKKLMAMESQVN